MLSTTRIWQPAARALLILLAIALIGRVLLLASGRVSFHSDEAIVGLMARHIVAGERPVFFFGQAYMGSLDAWLIALGFQLLGESVDTIRIVQAVLYLLVVLTAYLAGLQMTRNPAAAWISGLVFAVAPPLAALYTTATLGGYNETLIIGHLLIFIGLRIAHMSPRARGLWLLYGLLAGLGWWTNALITVYLVPVSLYVMYRWVRQPSRDPRLLVIAAAGFLLGSAPWWIYALQNDLAPVRFFLPNILGSAETVGAVVPTVPFEQRILGMLLFGLPSVIGMRFPWSGEYFAPLVGLIVLIITIASFYSAARFTRRASSQSELKIAEFQPGARFILFGMIIFLCALFLLTRFSSDPSGRYFLPLLLPFGVAFGVWVSGRQLLIRYAALALVIGYFAAGQIAAAQSPAGFTTQFVAQTDLPNTDDEALIAWLDERGIAHGYTTYWVSFRMAFLSGERLQLSAALPDKSDLTYTPAFERYPPYLLATDRASEVAYITAQVPELDEALIAWFADEGLTYQTAQLGQFRVYYDFEPTIPRPPFPFLQN